MWKCLFEIRWFESWCEWVVVLVLEKWRAILRDETRL